MVVASATPTKTEKILPIELPLIDLSHERSKVSNLITKACENYGFFKVINHGVPQKIISRMEEESLSFFSKPNSEKQRAGPACPFGYGSKNIGFNGDIGEVEYLLLNANPNSISQGTINISDDPTKFSDAVGDYIEAVREMACELLDLMAEGLWVPDASIFSRLIKDIDSDSVFRLNYYTPSSSSSLIMDSSPSDNQSTTPPPLLHKVGFGEHSDPQIITILRSNDVGGLQISLEEGVWSPVPPDPTAFWVNVGDLLQAMTNGRFLSVRHRVLTHPSKSRLSIGFFGAPSLHSCIVAPPQFVTQKHPLYRPFTWAEYKQAAYSSRLGETRLNLFKASKEDHNVS